MAALLPPPARDVAAWHQQSGRRETGEVPLGADGKHGRHRHAPLPSPFSQVLHTPPPYSATAAHNTPRRSRRPRSGSRASAGLSSGSLPRGNAAARGAPPVYRTPSASRDGAPAPASPRACPSSSNRPPSAARHDSRSPAPRSRRVAGGGRTTG